MGSVNATFTVSADHNGARLDAVLAELLSQHSRARIAQWIKAGEVLSEGKVVKPSERVWEGATIVVAAALAEHGDDAPESIALDVIFEDDEVLVVNKPAGLVVHPGAGNRTGTLLNALLHFAPKVRNVPRAGIVHRLDKETSGLMVVAKTPEAQTELVRQLQARTVSRVYVALVHGIVPSAQIVDGDIGRHPSTRTKMAVVTRNGKPARTHVTPIEVFDRHSLVECKLETGRTHQIRVHMAHLGFPLVGDPMYGKRKSEPAFARQALHARGLGLAHPISGEEMTWTSPLPDDLAQLIEALR